jgi:hypothetical protein
LFLIVILCFSSIHVLFGVYRSGQWVWPPFCNWKCIVRVMFVHIKYYNTGRTDFSSITIILYFSISYFLLIFIYYHSKYFFFSLVYHKTMVVQSTHQLLMDSELKYRSYL